MQLRTISSVFTFAYKAMFPVLWATTILPVVVSLFLGTMHGQNNQPPPEGVKWMALALFLGMMTFFILVSGRLKRVRLGNDQLYISNYLREISVPFNMIKDVKVSPYIRGNPVTIYFRAPTLFGNKITFMPRLYFRFQEWGKAHPIVNELKQLAKLP